MEFIYKEILRLEKAFSTRIEDKQFGDALSMLESLFLDRLGFPPENRDHLYDMIMDAKPLSDFLRLLEDV